VNHVTKAVYPTLDTAPAFISLVEAAVVANCPPAIVAQAISTRVLPRRKDGTVLLADALRFRDVLRPTKNKGVGK
jgi:hypothetical protein